MNYPKPEIKTIAQKLLIGKHLEMSMADNKTRELWQSFGPKIKHIPNRKDQLRYSLQVYPINYFQRFSRTKPFTKWAAVEVEKETSMEGLETLNLEKGKYAVFYYQGMPGDPSIFQYIYGPWIQNCPFQLDDRPHFEVLGEKYKPGSAESEEEIWIPIK